MSDIKNQFNHNNSIHYISSFGLRNFRIFEEYLNFKLKPITVLTGPNNAGKSSFTKALLLIKENEKEINTGTCALSYLNYFNGDHNLGNHQLVKNRKNENLVFYFTFFENYQFEINISPSGEKTKDYGITINGKNVISQAGGAVKFNVLNLVEFFKQRIEIIEFNNLENVNYFISRLEEVLKEFHSVDVDLYDYYELYDDDGNLKEKVVEIFKIKYEKLYNEGIYANLYNLECNELNIDYDYLDEYTLDETWYISLIYLFYKITNVELTETEIKELIPFSGGAFDEDDNNKMISFRDIIYIPTIKEHIKRTYSLIDSSIIFKLIRTEAKRRYGDFDGVPKFEMNIKKTKSKSEKEKEFSFLDKIEKFSEMWLKEFDIGEELSYGYNEDTDSFYIKIDNRYLPEFGFGYSQVLYIIFALLNENERIKLNTICAFPRTYIIEEPETGLHPSFQSKMAEMIVDASKVFGVNFIIETHSEYFIRKLQFLTANSTISPDSTVIYYFNNPKLIGIEDEQVKEITIDKYGGLSDDFGKGFIDEATTLKFDLLRINKNQQN